MLRPNGQVSDERQPPMALDQSLSQTAASRSLHPAGKSGSNLLQAIAIASYSRSAVRFLSRLMQPPMVSTPMAAMMMTGIADCIADMAP